MVLKQFVQIYQYFGEHFFFEVYILTEGSMIIGIAAKQMDIDNEIGQNAFSIGFNGFENCVVMNKNKYPIKNIKTQWKIGDKIEIYFNSYQKLVVFRINNIIVEYDENPFKNEFIFDSLQCHPAVSLDTFQQCYFNFDIKTIPKELENIKSFSLNMTNSILNNNSTNKMNNFNSSTTNSGKNVMFLLFLIKFFNYLFRTND